MTVVYIAGLFRGHSAWAIQQNVMRAMSVALDVWRSGMVALCPHANTMFFQGAAPDDVWLKGDLELVRRSDALLAVSDWQGSVGATQEIEYAKSAGIPVFYSVNELIKHVLEADGEKDREPKEQPVQHPRV